MPRRVEKAAPVEKIPPDELFDQPGRLPRRLGGAPATGEEARALFLWMTGMYTFRDIAEELGMDPKVVMNWTKMWPSKHQLAKRHTADVASRARALRDEHLLANLERELDAIDKDRTLVDTVRKQVEKEPTPSTVKDVVSAGEVVSRRADRIFNFAETTSKAPSAKPLVNINLLTGGAPVSAEFTTTSELPTGDELP